MSVQAIALTFLMKQQDKKDWLGFFCVVLAITLLPAGVKVSTGTKPQQQWQRELICVYAHLFSAASLDLH